MITRRLFILLVAQLMAVGLAFAAFLQPPDGRPNSENTPHGAGKRSFWVSRREKTDPDKAGNLALAVHVFERAGSTKAIIWQYDSVVGTPPNEKYKEKAGGKIECDCTIMQPGTNKSIKTEVIEYKKSQGGTTIGWSTRFMGGKGSGSLKNRKHSRVVFRYHSSLFRDSKSKKEEPGRILHEPCDVPPSDDVLEEEDFAPDPGQNAPPPLGYED